MSREHAALKKSFIFINRVSPEIAETLIENFGEGNVIQSEDGTHYDGEAFLRLFSQGQKQGQAINQDLSQDEKEQIIEGLNGAHITIVTATSGSNHRNRPVLSNLKNHLNTVSLRTFVEHGFGQLTSELDELSSAIRPTSATTRASSLESQIRLLKQYGAASVTVVFTKVAFDRQDRPFTKLKDGKHMPEYNAVKFREFMENLRIKGADRIVIMDPHSNDAKEHAMDIFCADWPMLHALRNMQKSDLASNINGSPEFMQYVQSLAKKTLPDHVYEEIQRAANTLKASEATELFISKLEDPEFAPPNTVYGKEAVHFISATPLFANDIVKRFGSKAILGHKVIFGPPDGMNKMEDVAVARAITLRDLCYGIATANGGATLKEKIQTEFRAAALRNNGCPAQMYLIEKERLSSTESQAKAMLGADQVKGRTAIIVDDIISGGGTMINAAKELRKAGAKEVHIYAAHGVFVDDAKTSKDALSKLLEAKYTNEDGQEVPLISTITVTDSIPSVQEKFNYINAQDRKRINIISINGLIADEVAYDYKLAREHGHTWHIPQAEHGIKAEEPVIKSA